MDLQNIQEQLNTEFAKADVRIIFWFDDKGDYAEEVSEIQLDTAKLHVLDGENWLYSKWLLNIWCMLHLQDQVTARIRLPISIIILHRIIRTGCHRCRRRLV